MPPNYKACQTGRTQPCQRDQVAGSEALHGFNLTVARGEQQMLSIGRALWTNSDLILLDEATEGLAPIVAQQIKPALGQCDGRRECRTR
jgi:ABC-type branched-subunit amino acid transport system ATPase component